MRIFIYNQRFCLLLIALSVSVFHNWFSFSIFQNADWNFYYFSKLKDMVDFSVWSRDKNFGLLDVTFWNSPLNFLYSIFGYLELSSNYADVFLVFFPIVILLPLGSYLLLKKILKYKVSAFVGSFVIIFNTYFLAISTQGHIMINASSAFCLFSVLFFIKALEKNDVTNYILSLLFILISTFYDLRISYITYFILFFCLLYSISFNNKHYENTKKLILKTTSFFILLIILSLFWILPQLSGGFLEGSSVLGRPLFGNDYWNILAAFNLFHPFWSGGPISWFNVQKIPLFFWLIPILVFGGLIVNKKNKLVTFFGFMSLLGIFLVKQSHAPFVNFYNWLYLHFPGFNAFREATKFYFFIALGYAVLIGSFVDFILKESKYRWKSHINKVLVLIIVFIFVFNTKPIITGEIQTMFTPRNIPNDYIILSNFINNEKKYYKIFWTPRDSRFSAFTNKNPKLSNVGEISSSLKNFVLKKTSNSTKNQIASVFKNNYSDFIFNLSSIKYVAIPIQDITNDDDFYKYYGGDKDPRIRQWYIDQVDKASWLKKINIGTKDLVVYENKDYKENIFSFSKLYNFVSLQNLDDKYDFTDKLGNDFYFVSSSTDKSVRPLIKIINLFENSILNNNTFSDVINNEIDKTKLYINLNISNLKTNLFLNNEPVSESNVSLSYSVNVFEYKNPEYKFENIIQNPSFENGTWQEKVGDCNNFDKNPIIGMSLNKETKSDGVQSLQLESTRHIACTAIGLNVVADSTYQFSFDYQSPNADHADYYLEFNDKNKTIINEDLPIKNKDWNTFSKTFKVPEGSTSVSLYVYADSTDEKTNIINRYDNFKLIQVPDLSNAYYLVSDPGIKFVEPKSITFDLINPTKKIVHIKGATTPFYLAMSESFHQQWQLLFYNSKVNGFFNSWIPFVKPDRISDEYHYKLNDFLNAWHVDVDQYCRNGNMCTKNADGSYDMEMVIEFFPQRWFYLGLLISGTTLVGCLGYLGYEGVKRIRIKIKKKNEKDN